jgi:hypothetical protein
MGCYIFSVSNVGGEIIERLRDLREAFIEVLVVTRVQDSFAAFDSDGAIAVQFNFVGPRGTFGEFRDQSAFQWLDESTFVFRKVNLSGRQLARATHCILQLAIQLQLDEQQ